MNEILGDIELVTTLVLLSLSVLHITYFKKINSYGIANGVFLFVMLLSVFISDKLIHHLSGYGVGFTRLVWYFGYAAVDLLAVVAISKIHLKVGVEFDKVAVFSVRMLQALAILQIVRFLDRHTIDIFGDFYQIAIPSINGITAIVLFSATCLGLSRKD